jgi:hypothetical protein
MKLVIIAPNLSKEKLRFNDILTDLLSIKRK